MLLFGLDSEYNGVKVKKITKHDVVLVNGKILTFPEIERYVENVESQQYDRR